MEDPAAKIFVGGLNHLTSANSLKVYFSRYGEVVATNIVFDRMTQKSRGFGFVQFTTVDTVRQVMPMEHTIDGKRVELKPAQKGVGSSGNNNNYNRKVAHSVPEYNPVFQKKVEEERSKNARKVFVGGLKLSTTTEGIIAYFERFGAVDECTITKNRQTGRSRGFGFVTFALQDTIDEVLKHRHAIEGKSVEIKRAENRGGKVPIIPDKKQDRNKGGSGPGGPRGSQGGFGGSGNIHMTANENVEIKCKNFDFTARAMGKVIANGALKLTGDTVLNIYGGIIDGASAASKVKASKAGPWTTEVENN